MTIQAGGDDTILDDSRTLHPRATASGVDSHPEVFPGQLHTFQMSAGHTEAADRAIGALAERARTRLTS